MKNRDELNYWLKLSRVENVGPKGFNKILTFLKQENKNIADLFKLSVKELGTLLEKGKMSRVDPVKILKNHDGNFDKLISTLEEKQIKVVTLEDNNYPVSIKKVLAENAPPLLYAYGNLALLDKKALAIVGSRHASEESVKVAQSIARLMVQRDICVISGYAAGIDSSAHWGALENNGATVIVLPYGILDFKWKEPFNNIDGLDDRVLVLSEFYPNTKWNMWSAMQRNKTIVALSGGVFAVEFTEDGGTFDTIKSTVRLKKPLFVINNAENRKVLERNRVAAIYVDQNSEGLVETILSNIGKTPPEVDRQISLF